MKKIGFMAMYLLFVISFSGYGMGKNDDLEWRRLMSEGSNYLIRASRSISDGNRKIHFYTSFAKCDNERKGMERWFSDLLAYSVPTNDMSCYANMLRSKTMMAYLTVWRLDSVKAYRELAKFLADVRSKRRPMTLERRNRLRKELYPNDSKYDFAAFRERWYIESRYQSALKHAELMTTRAFSNLLRQSSDEQKNRLIRILSEEVGRDFALQLIEPIAERGTNTVKKIDGVIVE